MPALIEYERMDGLGQHRHHRVNAPPRVHPGMQQHSRNATRIALLQERFDAPEAELVLAALGDWRISYEEDPPSERLIAAVVLAADGRLDGVDDAFRTAEQDWRDLLVGAGLANGDWPAVLDARLGPAVD